MGFPKTPGQERSSISSQTTKTKLQLPRTCALWDLHSVGRRAREPCRILDRPSCQSRKPLIITSRNDHVVPPSNSDYLAERVSGPVERVFLERSFHVATIDYDRDDIAARSVEFANKVTA